ncbi:leucyl aminopeptidase [Nibrella saemangeumensis]|uniref:Probable cytosol aminopeptidase n=1 Tax=Nibrella saemangeumensis TaxID=1084526 RepID=A0ABP8N7H9_9BACT
MHIQIASAQSVTPDALIIPVVQTDALAETLVAIGEKTGVPPSVLNTDFKAEAREVLPLYHPDGRKTYLLGLGKTPGSMDWLRAFRELFFKQKGKLPQQVGIDLTSFGADVLESVVLGVRGGGYDLRLYQTEKTDTSAFFSDEGQLSLLVGDLQQHDAQELVTRAEALAATQLDMMTLMNAPSNYMNPELLGEWAMASGEQHGYSVTVLHQDELEQQGLDALLSVNKGSDLPPVLIVAEYKPAGKGIVKTVGLVGKGVTFDTGGISIKPSANMHLMKSDMGGAAAVLGTVEAAAKLKLPVHLIGIVPATENMVDGSATKPGDVIGSYLGKTIEVIDTDAEGRIILADGLGYMVRNYQPEILIDLATLTGSVIAALGYHAAGLFTQDDELATKLIQAGDRTGERLWRMPLWDVYKEDIKSDVADLKNFSGKPIAGSISAAKFLEVFTENHPKWAHLDIAGMAFADTEYGSQKNATAYGVRLLIDFLRNL